MNPLEQLAGQHAMIMVETDTFVSWLNSHYEEAFMEGVRQGRYQAELAAKASAEEPYTKREAALALGFSEGTIDNMRRRGELESYEYGGQVRIERSEVARWKRVHSNLYNKMYNLNKKAKQ